MYENVEPVYAGEWEEEPPGSADLFLEAGSDLQTYARYRRCGGRILFAGRTLAQEHLYATKVILVYIEGDIFIHASRVKGSAASDIDAPGFSGTNLSRIHEACKGELSVLTFRNRKDDRYLYEYEEEVKGVLSAAIGLTPQTTRQGRKMHV